MSSSFLQKKLILPISLYTICQEFVRCHHHQSHHYYHHHCHQRYHLHPHKQSLLPFIFSREPRLYERVCPSVGWSVQWSVMLLSQRAETSRRSNLEKDMTKECAMEQLDVTLEWEVRQFMASNQPVRCQRWPMVQLVSRITFILCYMQQIIGIEPS